MITAEKMTGNSELYRQIEFHLKNDPLPSVYLTALFGKQTVYGYPFCLIQRMRDTEQSPRHHPEGNVFIHTMLVVDQAARVKQDSKDPRAFLWAALLHDIGKPDTTQRRNHKIISYDHDRVGAVLAEQFLREFSDNIRFIGRVTALVRWHMQILHVTGRTRFAAVEEMKREVDIEELALLGLCDRLGRENADREKEEETIQIFLRRCGL